MLYCTKWNDRANLSPQGWRNFFFILLDSDVLFQDGTIDYQEFVAMMQKGNVGGIGRRTMRNSLNLSMRDAPGAR